VKNKWNITLQYRDEFLELEMFQTKFVEYIKQYILCSITFFQISCHFLDNVEKCGTASQMAIWRMRLACRIRQEYRQTLRMCSTYCLPTATMVARSCLIVTLHTGVVRSLS